MEKVRLDDGEFGIFAGSPTQAGVQTTANADHVRLGLSKSGSYGKLSLVPASMWGNVGLFHSRSQRRTIDSWVRANENH